jgi:PAS domain S-box-containing protein
MLSVSLSDARLFSGFLDRAVLRHTSPEMTALVRDHDWARTTLGPIDGWSPALRSTVENLLGNGFGLLLWWGPSLAQIYNDAYRPVLGTKHPAALGQPAAECWPEIWHRIGPLIAQPLHGGPASVTESMELEPNRYGFIEECYFRFAYSPVFDDSVPGGIGGVLATVSETTGSVIGERRIRLLRELGIRTAEARTAGDVCTVAAEVLATNPRDVPFALIYVVDADGKAVLSSSAGIAADQLCGDELWPLEQVIVGRRSVVIPDLRRQLANARGRGWPVRPHTAVAIPIAVGPDGPGGVLVVGISPLLHFDQTYLEFVELLATPLSTAIVNANAYEAERLRAEALADLDRAKVAFFSNVSHEFRTPLTLMLGPLAELSQNASDEQAPLVESARRNALRLLKLVNALLEFSRLEAGRTEAAFVETDLAALTAELAGVFRSAVESAGLRFGVRTELTRPVFVDRSMWERIVLNLLSNALKFTLRGAIDVELVDAGDAAELVIADTGVGISRAELPRIFERFRRVRSADARSYEGSGIGLALVDELVRLHGGTVSVESDEGTGTRFRVRLPFGRAHLDPAHLTTADRAPYDSAVEQYLADLMATIESDDAPNVTTPTPTAADGRARILLADDNHDLRRYVTRVLAPFHDVVAVRNGRDALAALQSQPFDLVVSDIMMPVMDGVALLRAVRADDALHAVPLVFLSARAGEEAAIEALAQGANDYLVKPFTADELLARVNAHLSVARRSAHDLLAASVAEREFRALADTIPVMVWTADAGGWLDWYNQRWYAYTGQAPEEAAGWGWQTALHPDDAPSVMEAWPQAVATGSPFEMEFRLRDRDGTFRTFLTRAVPVRDEGAIVRWYGSAIDIQAQREVLERSRYVAETLQGVFLPRHLPHTSMLRVDAVYQAAERDALVGGDWCDAVDLPDGRVLLSIGDVTGHGVAASIVAGRLRHAIVDFALEHDDPVTVLERANRILRFEHPDTYASALVAFVDAAGKRLTFTSAGHHPPLVAQTRDRPARSAAAGGLLLGIADELGLSVHELVFQRDAVVALYTDGIVEFDREIGEAEKKLASAVARVVGDVALQRPAAAVRDAVLAGASTVDDAVVMIVQFSEVLPLQAPDDDGAVPAMTWRFHSSDAHAAHTSRHELMGFLRQFTADASTLASAELILGELLANTVEHAAGLVEIHIDWSEDQPVVRILDTGPGLTDVPAKLPQDSLEQGGRGLFLINALADGVRLSVQPGGGTEIRVVLPLRR